MKKKRTSNMAAYLGQTVHVKIDRPIGSRHPKHPDIVYQVNYGYLPGVMGGDGEEQDIYLLGVDQPVTEFTAQVIAVIFRENDREDKLVAAPEGMLLTKGQIYDAVRFQEQYFKVKIMLDPRRPVVRFYRGNANSPKTTMPAHLGANAIITCGDKILLERRRDSDTWGLVGGGVKKTETAKQAIAREIYEELGLRVAEKDLHRLAVYSEPGRIAAYKDGSIWRMVIVIFSLALESEPVMRISAESRELRFFTRDQLRDIDIVVTHSDIVWDWFAEMKLGS